MKSSNIYTTNEYIKKNPTLDKEDSPWKVEKIIPLVDMFIKDIDKKEIKLLDVGGGAGLILKEIADYIRKKGIKVKKYSLDLSPGMLKIQKKNNKDIKKLLNEDIKKTSLKNKEIDLTLMIDVLEHVPNPEEALKELRRISKYVIFKVPLEDNLSLNIINFIEKIHNAPEKVSVKAITDFFDSKMMLYELGLSYQNFNVLSYSLKEITLEKYRAVLTRKNLQDRDLFDLFLIKDSLKADVSEIVEKIRNSALIKKDLASLISEKLALLQKDKFFESEETIEELAVAKYNPKEFEEFKEKIKPILIEICKRFLL